MHFENIEEIEDFFAQDVFGLPVPELDKLHLCLYDRGPGYSEGDVQYEVVHNDGDLRVLVDLDQTRLTIESAGINIDVSHLPENVSEDTLHYVVDNVNKVFETIGETTLRKL